MFCGHFAIGQIYDSGLFHAITDVNVIVPLPSLAKECDEPNTRTMLQKTIGTLKYMAA